MQPDSQSSSEFPVIRELDSKSMSRWDGFVEASPEATFFHLSGWKEVLERAFGHRTFYLYAERGNRICGILPLAYIRSCVFGNALISTPFCVYGGTVAENEAARDALDKEACELAQRLSVDYLEFRNQSTRHPEWATKDLYVTFRKKIDRDAEKNFLKVPRKQRRMIRQGIKAGLVAEVDQDIERFYNIYAISVRNLGTPVFAKQYFGVLKKVFETKSEISTVTFNGKPIASVMSFYFRDTVLPYYGGSTTEARQVAANDFMYWELMCRACKRGITIFDYGRSKKGTGSYFFKKNWGFEAETLNYEYFLVRAGKMPDVNPLNPKYRLFVNVWKHMPLALSMRLGPIVAKRLG